MMTFFLYNKQYAITTILIVAIALISINAFSQGKTETQSKTKLMHLARQAEKYNDIFTAIDYYKICDKKFPGNVKIQTKLAYLYWQEKNYEEAQRYFALAYRKNNKNLILIYYSAKCLQIMQDYEKAKQEFLRFSVLAKKDKKFCDYAKQAKSLAEGLENFTFDTLNSQLLISHLDSTINSKHINFSPIPYNDSIVIFGSLRENEIRYYDLNTDTFPHRKFYLAEYNSHSEWQFSGEFDTVFNVNNADVGNGAFSADRKRFYFTKCKREDNIKPKCEIYVSHNKENVWQAPQRLPDEINLYGYTATMPTVGVSRMNSDILYFVSDRPEGHGGLDLWFTYFNPRKQEWKEVKNCGKVVNSVDDEITPFYDITTKTLYFSSNGQPGFGGFDIYKSFGEGKNFREIKNPGKPLNSNYDDQYFIFEENKHKGFFTSNRDGANSLRHKNCCDDIFEFNNIGYIVVAVEGRVLGISDSIFYYKIEEQYKRDRFLNLDEIEGGENIEILYDYRVDLYMVDNEGNNFFMNTTLTTPGSYFFKLERDFDYYISVKDIDGKEKTLEFTTKNLTHSDTIYLDPIIIYSLPMRPLVIDNIYYEFAKHNLTDESKTVLDTTIYKIMQRFPQIVVEISSHTDSIGSEEDNLLLSQNRAQSVVNYLVQKGILSQRLIAKGYGEMRPIAPNSLPDGSDNPEGRQRNRRTEFRIIDRTDNNFELLDELE